MPLDALIQAAQHPTSSRVLDALLDSPTVPPKARRALIGAFLGHFHVLVDDRIGSRVGERCWAAADPYLREKIARAAAPHEHALAGSFFGKFFARGLALHVLRRDPERWRAMQAESRAAAAVASAGPSGARGERKKSVTSAPVDARDKRESAQAQAGETPRKTNDKRKATQQDEIDAVFGAALGKKVKKAELAAAADGETTSKAASDVKRKEHKDEKRGKRKRARDEEGTDAGLEDVLGAIRSAPKEDKGSKKRKKAH